MAVPAEVLEVPTDALAVSTPPHSLALLPLLPLLCLLPACQVLLSLGLDLLELLSRQLVFSQRLYLLAYQLSLYQEGLQILSLCLVHLLIVILDENLCCQ